MLITLSEVTGQPQKKQPPKLKRFHKLWSQAEKLKKSNINLEQRLKEIAIEVAPIVEKVGQQICAATHDLVDKKLKFLTRKSLARWQRQELLEWTEESLHLLAYAEHADNADNARFQQQAEQMQALVESENDAGLEDWFDEDDEDDFIIDVKEQLENFEKDVNLGQAKKRAQFIQELEQQNDLFGHQESLAEFDRTQAKEFEAVLKDYKDQLDALSAARDALEGETDFDPFEDFDFGQGYSAGPEQEKQNSSALRKLLDGANVKKIFQQLARVLHPDREQDKERQAQKHELMAQAIKARDEGDILTLFSMHSAHVSGSELAFDNQQLEVLCLLLAEQITKLKQTKTDIIEDSPKQAQIFDLFYASSSKKVAKKVADYKNSSREGIDQLNDLVTELTSLKTLKPMLQVRYEMNRFKSPFDMLSEMFDEEYL